jgi:hypothetical protein
MVYSQRWVGFITPKSPACLIVVVGHTSYGSSARACAARVALPGAYAIAGIAPSFLGTRIPPTTKRWCPVGGVFHYDTKYKVLCSSDVTLFSLYSFNKENFAIHLSHFNKFLMKRGSVTPPMSVQCSGLCGRGGGDVGAHVTLPAVGGGGTLLMDCYLEVVGRFVCLFDVNRPYQRQS